MNFNHIYGLVLRQIYQFKRSFDKLIDIFFFSMLELVIWGMTSKYFESTINNGASDTPGYYVIAMISGILCWSLITRISNDIPFSMLDDLWSRNLINMFGSPLKVSEWLTATVIVGLIKAFAALIMGTIAAYFLYTVNVYNFGFKVLPFIFILILSSMWMGFFVSALIIRYGNKIQALAWSFSWMIAPFSAVYYPVSVLPTWAQWISAITPTSYMFEAARYLVATGNIDWTLLTKSLILSIVLLALSLSYFTYAFKKRLESGILKLQ